MFEPVVDVIEELVLGVLNKCRGLFVTHGPELFHEGFKSFFYFFGLTFFVKKFNNSKSDSYGHRKTHKFEIYVILYLSTQIKLRFGLECFS